MANSVNTQDLISSGQAQKELTANALFAASSKGMLYARRDSTSSALTWGYYGGNFGEIATFPNGTLTLTANATNFIQASKTTGVLSSNTTGFGVSSDFVKCYEVICGPATATSWTDRRPEFLAAGSSGGGGLVSFVENKVTTAPNATVPVVSLAPSASVTEANVDISIVPKGTGSFSLRVPDNTTVGGNKLGTRAVDLQLVAGDLTRVASGANSFAVGSNNTASGPNSIAMGLSNNARGTYCATIGYNNSAIGNGSVAIGDSNTTGSSSSINYTYSFGYSNSNSGGSSVVIGHSNSNTSTGNNSNYIFGGSNTCAFTGGQTLQISTLVGFSNSFSTGSYNISFCGTFGVYNDITGLASALSYCFSFGSNNRMNANYGILVGHQGSNKNVINSFAFGSHGGSNGSIQQGKYPLFVNTTAAGTSSLRTSTGVMSAVNIPTLQNNEVRVFTGTVIAKDAANTGAVCSWKIEGTIARFANAASTVFVGTPSVTQVGTTASATTNGYSIALVANATLGGLEVQFTYTAGGVVKVVAIVDMTESI